MRMESLVPDDRWNEREKWNERGRREQGAFAATVMRGDLSPDRAKQMQRENSGIAIQKKSIEEGGWIVSTPQGDRNFDNLAHVGEWAASNGALVHDTEGNLLTGQTVDSILERKAEYEQFDQKQSK